MLCYYPLVLSIRSPHLADDRGYNDHDSADDPGHAQRFSEKQCGKQQRGNRVNIAQNRDGLRFQPVHAISKERLTRFGLVSMLDYYTEKCNC